MLNVPEPATKAIDVPRDAIIFLPGLGRQWTDQSLELIACKIATALDRRYGRLRFTSEGRYDTIGGKKAKICTISMQHDHHDPPQPIIDVYELDYHTSLTQHFEDRTILGKSALMFIAICTSLPRVLAALVNVRKQGKTTLEQLQALYAIGIFLLLSGYMVILLLAVVGGGAQLLQPPTPTTADTYAVLASWLVNTLRQIGVYLAPIVIVLTFIFVLLREKVLQFIVGAATDYACLLNYMDYGERRNVITGQLETFLDKLVEQAGTPYRKCHLFAYSFGSIIALDTLFTFGVEIGEQTRHIDTLVTIGSPFDLIRTYWAEYFHSRVAVPCVPQRWINVYSPFDLLGSNFRNDTKEANAEGHIHCPDSEGTNGNRIDPKPTDGDNIAYEEIRGAKRQSLFALLTLQGLKCHSLYWEPSHEEERNCFSYILPRMYDADLKPLMTEPPPVQEAVRTYGS